MGVLSCPTLGLHCHVEVTIRIEHSGRRGVSSRRLPSLGLATSQAQAATRGCGGCGCTRCRPAGGWCQGDCSESPCMECWWKILLSCPCVQGVACCVGLCADATLPAPTKPDHGDGDGDGDAAPEWTDWASAASTRASIEFPEALKIGAPSTPLCSGPQTEFRFFAQHSPGRLHRCPSPIISHILNTTCSCIHIIHFGSSGHAAVPVPAEPFPRPDLPTPPSRVRGGSDPTSPASRRSKAVRGRIPPCY